MVVLSSTFSKDQLADMTSLNSDVPRMNELIAVRSTSSEKEPGWVNKFFTSALVKDFS